MIAAALAVSVATLLAAVAWWVPSPQQIRARRGGRAQLNVCGERKRLCVLVNEDAGKWTPGGAAKRPAYRVIQGY